MAIFKVQGQGWLRQYEEHGFLAVNELQDGYCGVNLDQYTKLDESGNIIFIKDLPATLNIQPVFLEDGFIGVFSYTDTSQANRYLFIKFDNEGDVVWEYNSNISTINGLKRQDFAVSLDGGLVIVYRDQLSFHKRLYAEKISSSGSWQWTMALSPPNIYNYSTISNVSSLPDGSFICFGNLTTPSNGTGTMAMKFDANGNLIWKKEDFNHDPFLIFYAGSTTITSAGNIAILVTDLSQKFHFATYDFDGNLLSIKNLQISAGSNYDNSPSLSELPSGDLAFVRSEPFSPFVENINPTTLYVISSTGDIRYTKLLDFFGTGYGSESYSNCIYTSDGHLLFSGYGINAGNIFEGLLVKADTFGNIFPYFIEGNIFNDQSQDCTFNGIEQPFKNFIVKAESPENTFCCITDSEGDYIINVPEGHYEIIITPPQNWETCQAVYQASVNASVDTAQLDVPLKPTVFCPLIQVEIVTARIRNCSTGVYVVKYCNIGTALAENATLNVTLDPALTYLSSTGNLVSQNGGEMEFALGNVESFGCGEFSISYDLPCGMVELGTTLCTEAHIYPDDPCLNNPYTGPIIEPNAQCAGDSVLFSILNTGGDMGQPLGYIVIEDNIILRHNGFQLTEGEELIFKEEAKEGATYHLIAMQDPDLPPAIGSPLSVASVEGCLGLVNPGAFSQFPHNSNPWHYKDCKQVIASFDPNDKTGFPTGWQDEHFIDERTDLDYLIRFQNTGTDTAFKVVIIDTLSAFLEPSSIRPGASSHPYRFELSGQGVAKFIFDDILLPDSNVNEALSHGFVQFHIAQQPGNQPGTRIENNVDIYFDFNAPVRTNTTFHTIREPWVQVVNGSFESIQDKTMVKISPNPMGDWAIIELDSVQPGENTLTLMDGMGRQVLQTKFNNGKALLQRQNLIAGIYFFTIENNGNRVGTGKLAVN
ncbi:MAG: T9SS type A sorting domain-containing protein [Saprospiraceae bacterium]|nr:T9SS type A sorting domain-containing protein [Saprospiraceae bacterium]